MSTQLLPPLLLAASGRGRRVPLLTILPLLALVAVTEQAGDPITIPALLPLFSMVTVTEQAGDPITIPALLPLFSLVSVTEQAGCTRVRIDNEEYEVDTTP